MNVKTVVITGSTRGLGYEMARKFRQEGTNVVINGVNQNRLEEAIEKLRSISGNGSVAGIACDVSTVAGIKELLDFAINEFGAVDIWINNAGVNQPMKAIWELTEEEIDAVLSIDLKGTIHGSRLAMLQMEKQPQGGYIYNVEGYGSNDAMMLGLNIYGTSKRAITHFTQAFAKELEERKSNVKAGRLSPGMMYTDFMVRSLGGKGTIELPEKTKKIYGILGDEPDVVADFLVKRMLSNTKNNAKIEWLTTGKVMWKFLTARKKKLNARMEKISTLGDKNGGEKEK